MDEEEVVVAPALNSARKDVGEEDELKRPRLTFESSDVDGSSSGRMSWPEALALRTSNPGILTSPGPCSVLGSHGWGDSVDQAMLQSLVCSSSAPCAPTPCAGAECALAAAAVATATATAALAAAEDDPEMFRGGRIEGPTRVH